MCAALLRSLHRHHSLSAFHYRCPLTRVAIFLERYKLPILPVSARSSHFAPVDSRKSAARINVLVTHDGNVGTPVLKALTTSEFSDRVQAFVLIRPASLADPAKKQTTDRVRALGVTVVEGDLEAGVPALTALLKESNIQTVVAVVGRGQIAHQSVAAG